MLTTAVQLGDGRVRAGADGLISVALILFVVSLGAAMGPVLSLAVASARGAARGSRSRRRRLRAAADAEARARALMSELCPHGWRAQITMFSADSDDHRPLAVADGALWPDR